MLDSLSSFPLTLQRSPQREGVIYSRFVHYREASIPNSRGALIRLHVQQKGGDFTGTGWLREVRPRVETSLWIFQYPVFPGALGFACFFGKALRAQCRAFVQGDKFK